MSLLLGTLKALGLGGQLFVAAVLFAGAIYAYKGAGIAQTAATLFASGLFYVVVTAVAVAIAIVAGWIEPNPGAFLSFASDVVSAGIDLLTDFLPQLQTEVTR